MSSNNITALSSPTWWHKLEGLPYRNLVNHKLATAWNDVQVIWWPLRSSDDEFVGLSQRKGEVFQWLITLGTVLCFPVMDYTGHCSRFSGDGLHWALFWVSRWLITLVLSLLLWYNTESNFWEERVELAYTFRVQSITVDIVKSDQELRQEV